MGEIKQKSRRGYFVVALSHLLIILIEYAHQKGGLFARNGNSRLSDWIAVTSIGRSWRSVHQLSSDEPMAKAGDGDTTRGWFGGWNRRSPVSVIEEGNAQKKKQNRPDVLREPWLFPSRLVRSNSLSPEEAPLPCDLSLPIAKLGTGQAKLPVRRASQDTEPWLR